MKDMFQKLLQTIDKHARIALVLSCSVLLIMFWNLKDIRLELDIYDVYDSGFQSSSDLSDLRDYFGDNSQMLVHFSFPENPKADQLCKLQNWARAISRSSDIKLITSLWSVRRPKIEGDRLWYPRTLEDPCLVPKDMNINIHESFQSAYFSHLLSRSGSSDVVLDVAFTEGESNTRIVEYVMSAAEKFKSETLPDVSLSFLGLGASRYYFKQIILKDSVKTFGVIFILLALLRLIYGTWRSGLLLIFTLGGATVILYGSMALAGIPVNILTNNLFLMTAVAGTADFIFVSHAQFRNNFKESFSRLITPCFYTTLTTLVGFLSLNISDVRIIREFGTGAAIGALAEWAMMFIFLPSLLKVLKMERCWIDPEKAFNFWWVEKIKSFKLPSLIVVLLHLLMVLSIPAFFYINDYDSPIDNLPSDHVLRRSYQQFKGRFGWEGQVYLYFPENPSPESKSLIVESIRKIPLVHKLEDPDELAREWTKDLPALKKELVKRELSLTPLWERYYSGEGHLRLPLYLNEQDLHSLKSFRDSVDKVCKNQCRLAGQRIVYLEYGETITRTMIESFVTSIILVLIILSVLLWHYGKVKYLFPVMASSLMGPLVTLTLISLFKVPVTLVTSIFLAVMVGLAGDNAIHFLLASAENIDDGIEERSDASIAITSVMILASTLFLFQSLLPMKILGVLFIAGFSINLIGDYWGLKSLLRRR